MNSILRLGICIMILLVIPLALARPIYVEESTVTARLVGDTAFDIITQLETSDLNLNHASYYGDYGTYSPSKAEIIESMFDDTIAKGVECEETYCPEYPPWYYDSLKTDFDKYKPNELIVIEADGKFSPLSSSHDAGLFSFRETVKPDSIDSWKERFTEVNPLFVFDSAYSGLSLPNQPSFVNELTRYTTMIAPNAVNSREFVLSLMCNLGDKTTGELYRDARNQYYLNAEPSEDEMIGLVLDSYALYGNPLTYLTVPNDPGDLGSNRYYNVLPYQCYNRGGGYRDRSDFGVQEIGDGPQLYGNFKLNYSTLNLLNYTVISGPEIELSQEEGLMLPYIKKQFNFPLDTVINEVQVYFSNPINLTIKDYPSWNGSIIDKECRYKQKNISFDKVVNYMEDHESISLFIYPMEVVNCYTGEFRIFTDIGYAIAYSAKSPVYISDLLYEDYVYPGSEMNITILFDYVYDAVLTGDLELLEEDKVIYQIELNASLDRISIPLVSNDKEKKTDYILRYIEDNITLIKRQFSIETKKIAYSIQIPDKVEEDVSAKLILDNLGDKDIKIIIKDDLIEGNIKIIGNEHNMTIKPGITETTFNYEGLSRKNGAYVWLLTLNYEDHKDVITTPIKTNKQPILNEISEITVKEGDTVKLNVSSVDPDGDEVIYSISEPVGADSEWQTSLGDAGNYSVEITANDGFSEDKMFVHINVLPFNRPPLLHDVEDIHITEGDSALLIIHAEDLDRDNITYHVGDNFIHVNSDEVEWYEWLTKLGDAGDYTFSYMVSDGKENVTKTFDVHVERYLPANVSVIDEFSDGSSESVINESSVIYLNLSNEMEVLELSMDIDVMMKDYTSDWINLTYGGDSLFHIRAPILNPNIIELKQTAPSPCGSRNHSVYSMADASLCNFESYAYKGGTFCAAVVTEFYFNVTDDCYPAAEYIDVTNDMLFRLDPAYTEIGSYEARFTTYGRGGNVLIDLLNDSEHEYSINQTGSSKLIFDVTKLNSLLNLCDGYCQVPIVFDVSGALLNISNLELHYIVVNKAPVILNDVRSFEVREGESLDIIIDAFDMDDMNYSVNDSRLSQAENRFTWQTQEGDSGCDDLGMQEIVENECRKRHYFEFKVSDGEKSDTAIFTVDVIKRLYTSTGDEIDFWPDPAYSVDTILGLWTDPIISDVQGYKWYVNDVMTKEGEDIYKDETTGEGILPSEDLSWNGEFWLGEEQKTRYIYLPWNANLTEASIEFEAYDAEEEPNFHTMYEDEFMMMGEVDCASLCQDRGDHYYCTGPISCSIFDTDKGIIFENAAVSTSITGATTHYIRVKTSSYLKIINSTLNSNGYNGCYYCSSGYSGKYGHIYLDANKSMDIINSNFYAKGGNGGRKDGSTDRCGDGSYGYIDINTYLGAETPILIKDSYFEYNGGEGGSPGDNGGCDGGGANFEIRKSSNISIDNCTFKGYSGTATSAVDEGYSGGETRDTDFDIISSGNISITNSKIDMHTNTAGNGDEDDGGSSGDTKIEINTRGDVSVSNTEFIYYTGNGGHGDCGDEGCGDGGGSGDSDFKIDCSGKLNITSSVFKGYTGIGGNGDKYNTDYDDGGDAGWSDFTLDGDQGVYIAKISTFDIHGGAGGNVGSTDLIGQEAGDGGDVMVDIESDGDIILEDIIFNIYGGNVDSDAARGGDGGYSDKEIESDKGSVHISNVVFNAYGRDGSDISAKATSPVWRGGDGGYSKLEIDAYNDIIIKRVDYNGFSGKGGDGEDGYDIGGNGGDTEIDFIARKGDIEIYDSNFDSLAKDAGDSAYGGGSGWASGGSSLNSFVADRLYINNSVFDMRSGRGYYKTFNGNVDFFIDVNRLNLENTRFDISKGNGGTAGDTAPSSFRIEPYEEMTTDPATAFVSLNMPVNANITFSNTVLSKLYSFDSNFDRTVDVYAPDYTLLVFDTDAKTKYIFHTLFNTTSDTVLFSRHIPVIKEFYIATKYGLGYDFEDVISNFTYYDEDGDEMLWIDYKWYIGGTVVDEGRYTQGEKPILDNDLTEPNKTVNLVLRPYDGEYYGELFNSSRNIMSTDYNRLDGFNVSINTDNVTFYDLFEKYEPDGRVDLNPAKINAWLRKNCKKNYCKIPVNFASPKNITLKYSDLEINYSLMNEGDRYYVELEPSYTKSGDRVRLQLINDEIINSREIIIANIKPEFKLENLIADEGQLIRIQLPEHDPEGQVITYSSDKFEVNRSILSWQTGFNDSGEHIIKVVASDGIDAVMKNFSIIINNVNREPVVNLDDVNVFENESAIIYLNATDPDGDELVYFNNDSRWISFGQELRWQTAVGDAGDYTLEVNVSDGEDVVVYYVNITVKKINMPPILDLTNISLEEGETAIIFLNATDNEGDGLTYWHNDSRWIRYDRELIWNTSFDDAGEYVVSVNVSDGYSIVTSDVNVIVRDVNRQPAVESILAPDTDEGKVMVLVINATDPDGDILSYYIDDERFVQDQNVFTWQTTYEDAGEYVVEVNVSDGEHIVTSYVNVKVKNVNRAPALSPISDVSVYENEIAVIGSLKDMVFEDDFSDADAWEIHSNTSNNVNVDEEVEDAVYVDAARNWETASRITHQMYTGLNDFSAEFDIKWVGGEKGIFEIGWAKTDEYAYVQSHGGEIPLYQEISAWNDSVGVKMGYGGLVTLRVRKEHESILHNESGNCPFDTWCRVKFERKGNEVSSNVTLLETGETIGEFRASLTDIDPYEYFHISTYDNMMNNVHTYYHIDNLRLAVSSTNSEIYAFDPDGDEMSYSINDSRFSLENNMFKWQTTYEDAGDYVVEVNVSDGKEVVTSYVNVEVKNVNRAPIIIEAVSDEDFYEEDTVEITVNAYDADGDALVYTVDDSRFSITDNILMWQTKDGDNGFYEVMITASDGEYNDTEMHEFSVRDVCFPQWVLNDTWTECGLDNMRYKGYYDLNGCGIVNDSIAMFGGCDYCLPEWKQVNSSCMPGDYYDVKYEYTNTCCAETGLESDCTIPGNLMVGCDYCQPSWKQVNSSCMPGDYYDVKYEYTNTCCAETGLETDCTIPGDLMVGCDYCIPDWQCSGWSDCVIDTKTRSCEDVNDCGEGGRPDETLSCDPCENVSCDDGCLDDIYLYEGVCDDGECIYEQEDCSFDEKMCEGNYSVTNAGMCTADGCGIVEASRQYCALGCDAGECNADPCEEVTCANSCLDNVYLYAGQCIAGSCKYSQDDCGELEGFECEGNYRVEYASSCSISGCEQTEISRYLCSAGCSDGECNDDPCEGIVCEDHCEGSDWHYDGSCMLGKCGYKIDDDATRCMTPDISAVFTKLGGNNQNLFIFDNRVSIGQELGEMLGNGDYESAPNAYVCWQGQNTSYDSYRIYRTPVSDKATIVSVKGAVGGQWPEIEGRIRLYNGWKVTQIYNNSITYNQTEAGNFSETEVWFRSKRPTPGCACNDCSYVYLHFLVEKVDEQDSCYGVKCEDHCDGTTLYTDGTCTDGKCSYKTIGNSAECGYEIQCYNDEDCGTVIFDDSLYCQANIVVQNYTLPKCRNPGTTQSYCYDWNWSRSIEICKDGCLNGFCKKPDLVPKNLRLLMCSPQDPKLCVWEFTVMNKGYVVAENFEWLWSFYIDPSHPTKPVYKRTSRQLNVKPWEEVIVYEYIKGMTKEQILNAEISMDPYEKIAEMNESNNVAALRVPRPPENIGSG